MKLLMTSLTLALALSSCAGRPGKRTQLILVPDAQMNLMGEEAYAEILAQSQLSSNTALNNRIREVGERIAAASGVDYAWEFNVIQDDQANAFCLPGGKVAVYTGLIPIVANNAGLAAVMGHEVAHAILRHAAERVTQQYLVQGGLALASLGFANSEFRDGIAAALGIGAQFGLELPFSRFHESEADRLGLELMAKAGYDPREAVELWNRMGEASGGRVPELLSTHPDPSNRAKDLSKHMDEALNIYANSAHVPTQSL